MEALSSSQACLFNTGKHRHIHLGRASVSFLQRRSSRVVAPINSSKQCQASTWPERHSSESPSNQHWLFATVVADVRQFGRCAGPEAGMLESISAKSRCVALFLYRALLVGGIGLSLATPAIASSSLAPGAAATVQKAVEKAAEKIPQSGDTENNPTTEISAEAAEAAKSSENVTAAQNSENVTATESFENFIPIDTIGAQNDTKEAVTVPQSAFPDEFWKDIDLSKGSMESILKQILDNDSNNISALECLAKRLIEIDDSSHALVVLDKLLALQPDELEWKYMKAQTYDLDGQFKLAKQGFKDILKIEPFSSKALQGLVIAMDQLNETDDALKIVHDARIIAKQENHLVEARNMGMLIGQFHTLKGNFQEALKLYKEMLEEDASDFRPHLCQGIIYSVLGEKDIAEEEFKEFEKLCPEDIPDRKFLEGIMSRAKREGQKIYDLKHKRKARTATKGKM